MSNPPKRKPAIDVHVSTHARERARQRFPRWKAARIVDEVREALLLGRFSTLPPPGVEPYGDCLYAWNADRCYPLGQADNGFVVLTTLARPGETVAAASLREKRAHG
jgi:hypothetical protein